MVMDGSEEIKKEKKKGKETKGRIDGRKEEESLMCCEETALTT